MKPETFRSAPALALATTLTLLAPSPVRARDGDVPPDTSRAARYEATLVRNAGLFQSRRHTNCVQFGFATIYLAAALEAHERGLANGIALADAVTDIRNLADDAIELVGTGDTLGRCAWDNPDQPGSPAALHGALGLGLVLHRYGDDLPTATRNRVITAMGANWRGTINPYLVNGNLSIVAGRLLAGEYLGYDSALWQQGLSDLEAIFEQTRGSGGLEMNSPTYTHYHFAALAPLSRLAHDRARTLARILVDYELLVQAHLYLPGGGLGAPRSRDRTGMADDGMPGGLHRMLWLLTGDDPYTHHANVHITGPILGDYAMPEVMRSIFLDKGEGYTFHAYTDDPVGASRYPNSFYRFGEGIGGVAPWQAVVLPDAMLGINYGWRFQAIHASMGVYAKAPDGRFPILYHGQPAIAGDTHDGGGRVPSIGAASDPDDFRRELYDYERMMHGRTLISIWDPTLAHKGPNVTRGVQDTRALVPDWSRFGGEMQVAGRWHVGRIGDAYIAYRPIGTLDASGRRGDAFYFRLAGRSGAIVELATTDEFETLDDYVADLTDRHYRFNRDPLWVEFDARDPATGTLSRMRLEYLPERRFLDEVEIPVAEALDHGLLKSPWVDWDPAARVLTVARGCHDTMLYRWSTTAPSVETGPPQPERCNVWAGTIFSDVPYFGDFANWEPRHPERWYVVDEDGDDRLWLAPWTFERDGDRLGEYALVRDRTYEDFEISLQVRSGEDLDAIRNVDHSVVFGWQDESHYYFFMANETPEYSELFVLEDGERRSLATANASLVPTGEWHAFSLSHVGGEVTVRLDGEVVLVAETDGTFGAGRVGVGSFNDSMLFDDIAITVPQAPVDPDADPEPEPAPDDPGPGHDPDDEFPDPDPIGDGDPSGDDGPGPVAGGCECAGAPGAGPAPVLLLLLALVVAAGRPRAQKVPATPSSRTRSSAESSSCSISTRRGQ